MIYKHTNTTTGKSYIGLTSKSIDARWKEHLTEARGNSDRHFHRAIRLYGETSWAHEVLADNIKSIQEANTLEKKYIAENDTFNNGYNLTDGGDFFVLSEESKQKSKDRVRKAKGTVSCCFWDTKNGVKLCGYPGDVASSLGLPKNSLVAVAKGREVSAHGVMLYDNYCKGAQLKNKYEDVYTLKHKLHGVVSKRVEDFLHCYPELTRKGLLSLLSKTKHSYKGWRIEGTPDVKFSLKGVKLQVIDKDSGDAVIFTSINAVSKRTGIRRDKIKTIILGMTTHKKYDIKEVV